MEKKNQNPCKKVAVATLCLGLFFAVSCNKLLDLRERYGTPNGSDFTVDYTLDGSGCKWFFNDMEQDSLYVINSQQELLSFISCTGNNMPPAIDFNLYSLLLAHGNTNYGSISNITQSVELLPSNEYKLNVAIYLQDTIASQQWHVARIVPKIVQNTRMLLNVYYPITGIWEYVTPPKFVIEEENSPEVTITLVFESDQAYASISPQDFDPYLCPLRYAFMDGQQFMVCDDTMYWQPDDRDYYPLFTITRLSPNSMKLHYNGRMLMDKNNFFRYLFNRKTN